MAQSPNVWASVLIMEGQRVLAQSLVEIISYEDDEVNEEEKGLS